MWVGVASFAFCTVHEIPSWWLEGSRSGAGGIKIVWYEGNFGSHPWESRKHMADMNPNSAHLFGDRGVMNAFTGKSGTERSGSFGAPCRGWFGWLRNPFRTT